MPLKTDLKRLRTRFWDEVFKLRLFREDSADIPDNALDEFQPFLKRLSILKGKLTRKRGHSVMFSLRENEHRSLYSPSSYRFIRQLASARTNAIKSYPILMNEMTIVYLIAVFEAYMIDLIKLVLIYNKTLLKSSRHISYGETFKFKNIEALRIHLIEDEIASLAYKSFRDQCKYISDKLDISFELRLDWLENVSEIIETRNLLIHNRGIVNELYKRNVPNTPLKVGDKRGVDDNYVEGAYKGIASFEHHLWDSVLKNYCSSKGQK